MTQGFALRGTLAMAALAALAGCASTDSGWATPSDTGLSADALLAMPADERAQLVALLSKYNAARPHDEDQDDE